MKNKIMIKITKQFLIPICAILVCSLSTSAQNSKTKHDIATPPFRGGFDYGYNPPLLSGQNVILIQLEMDKELPTEWDFSVVGGIEKLKFL